jgi:DNA polymerase-3 subunit epsilon
VTARWHEGRLCAFDVETTASDPCEARIVQACIAHVGGGELPASKTWLVDPGIEIPAEASAIHGITTERARTEGMPAATAAMEIAQELRHAWMSGEPVVAMNAAYDLTVIDRETRRHGLPTLSIGPVIDPFVLDKHFDRFRKGKRTLTALCAHYQARLDGAHDAASDAVAAARVAYRIAKVFREVGAMEIEALHEAQARWYAEQAASLEDYFRRQGKTETCNREWPLRKAA